MKYQYEVQMFSEGSGQFSRRVNTPIIEGHKSVAAFMRKAAPTSHKTYLTPSQLTGRNRSQLLRQEGFDDKHVTIYRAVLVS